MFKKVYFLVILGFVALLLVGEFYSWTVNRIYVPEGHSLQLRYKGPFPGEFWADNKQGRPGFFAQEDEIGVRERMVGPGRHFYSPIWWERTLVPDIVLAPGEVGIVTCKLGDPLPEGDFLVDGEIGETKSQGILRKALGPGRYRMNPYAYTVKIVKSEEDAQTNGQKKSYGWVYIPTGFVGVVTNLANNPLVKQLAGIQDKVLPPGIYPINGREQQVDIVSVGYMESTISINPELDAANLPIKDESGEPLVKDGINFPSSDGFPIHLDYTLIWGLLPDQAPHAIKMFGNLTQIENKVIVPQIESICRNNGSEYSAVELLVGEKREVYQNDVIKEMTSVLKEKQVAVLYGLIRHIYIPQAVRKPIQSAFIADELTLTRTQEQTTAKTEGLLREAERKVMLETEKVKNDTTRLQAVALAEGNRVAQNTEADTVKLKAVIDRKTAEFNAQALMIKSEAINKGKQLSEEAKADKFKLAVEAFGTPAAYNQWVFATGLPDNIELKLFYAGPGTLWTDMKNLNVLVDPNKTDKK